PDAQLSRYRSLRALNQEMSSAIVRAAAAATMAISSDVWSRIILDGLCRRAGASLVARRPGLAGHSAPDSEGSLSRTPRSRHLREQGADGRRRAGRGAS